MTRSRAARLGPRRTCPCTTSTADQQRTFANLEEDVETEDAWEIASRRVSVISRRPSNHSIRLPRDDGAVRPSANDVQVPEGAPSSSVGFGTGAASVDELLAGNGSDNADSAANSEAGHTAEAGVNPAAIPIPTSSSASAAASGEGSRRASSEVEEPETAMVSDLQTPRNDYFLSSFSPMALAQAQGPPQTAAQHLGEPSMHQQLERAEQEVEGQVPVPVPEAPHPPPA